jgi:hypothetical protein
MAVRIGDLLLKEKRITPEQLQEAVSYQRSKGGKLGLALTTLGYVKEQEITALLSKQFGVPSVSLKSMRASSSSCRRKRPRSIRSSRSRGRAPP